MIGHTAEAAKSTRLTQSGLAHFALKMNAMRDKAGDFALLKTGTRLLCTTTTGAKSAIFVRELEMKLSTRISVIWRIANLGNYISLQESKTCPSFFSAMIQKTGRASNEFNKLFIGGN